MTRLEKIKCLLENIQAPKFNPRDPDPQTTLNAARIIPAAKELLDWVESHSALVFELSVRACEAGIYEPCPPCQARSLLAELNEPQRRDG